MTQAGRPQRLPIDAFTFLKTFHRKIAFLNDEYVEFAACDGLCEERFQVAMQICASMEVLLALRSELPLSVLSQPRDADEDAVNEWGRELIARVVEMDPAEDMYDPLVSVIGELCGQLARRDVRLLQRLKESGVDLITLGAKLAARAPQLFAELDAGSNAPARSDS
jgi:hypothetical protein